METETYTLDNPICSTDSVWRGADEDRCLSDDLDAIEDAIEALETDKADSNHTHSGYASSSHTHSEYAPSTHTHTGYASVDHTHDDYAESDHTHSEYASAEHTHSGYAPTNHTHDYAASGHTHTPDSIGAAAENHTHSGYAATNHTHADYAAEDHAHSEYSATNHTHSASDVGAAPAAHTHSDKADLVNGVIPISQIPNEVKEVRIVANIAARNAMTGLFAGLSVYVTDATGDTTVNSGGAYYLYNGTGWIKTAEAESLDLVLQWANIQGAPTSMPANGGNADTVDNKHASDFATAGHTHTAAGIGAAASNHTHSAADVGAATADHTHTAASVGAAASGHTHTASDVGAAASNHNHDSAYAASNHKHTEHNGDISVIKANGPGINLQATSQNVKTRIHKNSSANADYGTIISDYAVDGHRDYLTLRRASPYAENKLTLNVEDGSGGVNSYKIYGEHNKPGVLWSGASYMNASHTITPTKKLSECRTGWMLLWSDYDESTATVNDADFCTTFIPRCKPNGSAWSGHLFNCDIPRYFGTDLADTATEKRIMKMIYVHDDKIVGHSANNQDTRTDVVLRAVYEV